MSSPAGWYPDPADTSVRRWWDGHRWTSRLSRHEEAAPTAATDADPESPTPRGGRWWKRDATEVDLTIYQR